MVIEGAVLLPEYIAKNNIDYNKYICIVPTEDFQISKYSERNWIRNYLEGCSDQIKSELSILLE